MRFSQVWKLKKQSKRIWSWSAFRELAERFSRLPETSVVMVVGSLFGEPVITLERVFKGTIIFQPYDALEYESSMDAKGIYTSCGKAIREGRLKVLRKSVEATLETWVFGLDGLIIDTLGNGQSVNATRALAPFVRMGGGIAVLGRMWSEAAREAALRVSEKEKSFKDAMFATRA